MTGAAGPARLMRALLWAAALLFGLVVAVLGVVAHLELADAVLLGVLLALVPMLSLAQLPLIEGEPVDRMPAYWGSIVMLGVLGLASLLVGARDGGPAALGLVALPLPAVAAWAAMLTAGGLAVILVFRRLATAVGTADSPLLRELLPRTPAERRVFLLLSMTAGLAEEVAYRGYVIPALAPLVGTGGAAVLGSVAFGVVHGYQGMLGVVRTALVGGLLAWGFLASGSLWPAILAHASIDVLAGLVLGERLLSHGTASGVDRGSDPAPPAQEL